MPVGTVPGRWNWGYDGTYPYAPCAVYGGPEGLRRLVDAAHRRGLGVILDVVYNHLGPEGNYLRVYSDDYFTDRYQTPWGEALNYDGPNAEWVRRWAIANACHWVREYHLDGLRLDAVHAIHDASPRHLVAELAAAVRAVATRPVVLIAESDANDVRLIAPAARGGYGLDAVWADDFHHAVHTYLTGERDGYYEDYSGRLADVGRALGQGFLYQGERSAHLGRPRGTRVTDEPAERFVFCLQNHDQVGNRAFGERLHHLIDRERYAVATAVLLLAPETPLLFMGQEFAASAPFQYFTDHPPELGRLVTAGRRNEFRRFQAFADPARRAQIPDPQAEATFLRSKLDLGERARNRAVYRLYRDLLRLRRTDPVFADPSRERLAAWTPAADLLLVHRWRGGEHRLLVANFGSERTVPLEAPPGRARPAGAWRVWLSTAARRYGGAGRGARVERRASGPSVRIAARTAAVLACGSEAG
jgi:maltooligosyltrehalose trehalohydrolase